MQEHFSKGERQMERKNVLKQLYDEIPSLIDLHAKSDNPKIDVWITKVERELIKRYGENSFEHRKFNEIYFTSLLFDCQENELIDACIRGLKLSQELIKSYLEDPDNEPEISKENNAIELSKVFIVHGHDGELKEAVARLLEKQDIDPVILGEKANQGKTIIEKIENYSDVGAAIMLFTADDYGRAKDSELEQYRARQNVVFEAGYFMAKLGRDHTIMLAAPNVEIPSDLQGVVYTDTVLWKFGVLQELQAMGYSVDLNNVL